MGGEDQKADHRGGGLGKLAALHGGSSGKQAVQ
jgi:hypothetical protein